MRIDTQSQVFVFRSVIEDDGPHGGSAPAAASPAMKVAMAWSTPLPLTKPSTATSIRPLPLADLRLLTAYASEPPQLRDASTIPPPPVPRSSFTKAVNAARAPRPAPSRASSLGHALTLAAPYAAALLVFGVAQAKWASDAWRGMAERDLASVFETRAPNPAPVIEPIVVPAQPAAPDEGGVAEAIESLLADDGIAKAPSRATRSNGSHTSPARAPAAKGATVPGSPLTPGSAPKGSR